MTEERQTLGHVGVTVVLGLAFPFTSSILLPFSSSLFCFLRYLLSQVSAFSHRLLPTLSLAHLTKKQPRTWSLCYPSATHPSSPPSSCPLLTLASQETPHLLQSGFLHGKTRARHQYTKMGHPGTDPRRAGDRGPQRAKDTFGS